MQKIKFTLLVGLVVLMVAMFVGCDPEAFGGGSGERTGKLIINFSTSKGRSINWEPEISMEIDSYEISGIGPGKRTFGPITADGTKSVTVPGLHEGTWSVTVLGLNETSDAIGESFKDVIIEAGKTVSETFRVEEYTGDGTLSLEVDWPEGELENPHILVVISKTIGGEPVESWVMTPIEGESKAIEEKTLAAGSYSITIAIYEGDPDSGGKRLTGVNGSIRIAEGKTTSGSLIFDKDSLKLFGHLSVLIEDGMPAPFSVALSKDSDKVWDGHPVTLTATPSLPGEYAYYWFIDGKLQDEETNNFVLDDQLTYGAHFIGVTVLKNGIFASAHTTVTYGDDPGLFFVLQLLEPGTDTVLYTFDFELSIPNYRYFSMTGDREILTYEQLSCRNLVCKYEPTNNPNNSQILTTSLFPVVVTRELNFFENYMDKNNLTMAGFGIRDFENRDTLIFDVDELDGYFTSDQLDSSTRLFYFISVGIGSLEITELGTVGGLVSGNASIKNAKLSNSRDGEILTFDIKAEFSFRRENDLIIKMQKLTYSIDNTTEYYIVPGHEHTLKYDYSFIDDTVLYTVSAWSTSPGGHGQVFDEDNIFSMPEEDVVLYPIYSINPVPEQ